MSITVWAFFCLFIILMLALDLGVFHKKPHAISVKEALSWTLVWVILSILFCIVIYFMYRSNHPNGPEAVMQYLTGYLIEESLSVDNIFVMALIFNYFHIHREFQHRILFWGILGAIVMRGFMITIGIVLIQHFSWMVYVFGALLLITAIRMMFWNQDKLEPEENFLLNLAKKILPLDIKYKGGHFFTKLNGKTAMTPIFVTLLIVESMDLVFAVDSIPAIIAITQDPFIVFTSNIFAILGLRSLYFALAGLMNKFEYMKVSLTFILAFIGIKMVLSHHLPIPTAVSLVVIILILVIGIGASIIKSKHIHINKSY
ncbi:MAG: TerC family protein [Deltaproteobacteria bacterium]|nr:TerC family protein [Deltaproteobacteria bacterium]